MADKHSKSKSTDAPAQAASAPVSSVNPAIFVGGLICLAVAVTMTVMLVLSKFDAISLPGCGAGGGCAELTNGKWGKIPGIGFPVSFVGFAYFSGLLLAWLAGKGSIPPLLKNVVRVGILGSAMFLVVMLVEQHFCQYCFFTHLANFAFWGLLEFGKPLNAASLRAPAVFAGVFAISCGVLFGIDSNKTAAVTEDLNAQVNASTSQIAEVSRMKAAQTTTAPVGATTTEETVVEKKPPFTGRYRWGPEVAPVRILMYTDYQCPDCRAVEAKARQILEAHDNVSLSIKNFPMDASCNPSMSRTLHSNACWAARAAEAAGMLYGNDGFWKMHTWLFDRRGAFTDSELRTGLAELGFEPQSFIQTMISQTTLDLVQADAKEAVEVGIFFTPMIFINGVHLRGVFEQNADKLRQSVETLLAQNLPPLSAEHDEKPTAIETVIGDWKEEYPRVLPPDQHPWLKGPENAKLKIVMWADFQERWTATADAEVMKWIADKPDVSYSFRHFPFNQECNKVVSRTAHPNACLASKAAEAAGALGGNEAYWRMHVWLMTNQSAVSEQTVVAFANSIGINADEFTAKMNSEEVLAAIDEDCRAAKPNPNSDYSLLYRGGIPTIYLNGRAIPRWRLDNTVVVDKVLDAAYADPNPARR